MEVNRFLFVCIYLSCNAFKIIFTVIFISHFRALGITLSTKLNFTQKSFFSPPFKIILTHNIVCLSILLFVDFPIYFHCKCLTVNQTFSFKKKRKRQMLHYALFNLLNFISNEFCSHYLHPKYSVFSGSPVLYWVSYPDTSISSLLEKLSSCCSELS